MMHRPIGDCRNQFSAIAADVQNTQRKLALYRSNDCLAVSGFALWVPAPYRRDNSIAD
jgi:hypothetical protein